MYDYDEVTILAAEMEGAAAEEAEGNVSPGRVIYLGFRVMLSRLSLDPLKRARWRGRATYQIARIQGAGEGDDQ